MTTLVLNTWGFFAEYIENMFSNTGIEGNMFLYTVALSLSVFIDIKTSAHMPMYVFSNTGSEGNMFSYTVALSLSVATLPKCVHMYFSETCVRMY